MSQSQVTVKDPDKVDVGDMGDKGDKGKSKKKGDEPTPARKKMDDARIKVVDKDGTETFKCDECGNDFKTMTGAKQHMAKKHRARSEDGEEDDEAKRARTEGKKDTSFNEEILEGFDDTNEEALTASQVASLEEYLSSYDNPKIKNVEESSKSSEVKEDDDDEVEDGKLESAKERIQELEEELNETKAKLESLERDTERKDNLIDLFKSTKEELEREAINKDATINRYQKHLVKLKSDNDELIKQSNTGLDKDNKAKIKKLNEEMKVKDKKVADTEKKLLEATKKVGEESNKRVEAEIRMKSLEKALENLTKLTDIGGSSSGEAREQEGGRREQGSRRKEQESERREHGGSRKDSRLPGSGSVCRDLLNGWCSYGSACMHFHPEGVGREAQVKQVDCIHWLDGHCMFPDNKCKNIHDLEKKGTKKKSTRQDFSEALAMVKEVRDAVAGGAFNSQAGQGNRTPANMMQQSMLMPNQQQLMMNQQQLLSQQPMTMMIPQNMMTQMNPVSQMMMTPQVMMMQPGLQMQQQPGMGGGQAHLTGPRQ